MNPQTSVPVKLSILMPVRNEGVNIPIMLKILRAVVEVPHEVLIVYDDPSDDSVPVVEALRPRYPNLRPIHNAEGNGVAGAIRAGIRHARGEYILIFAVDETGPVLAIDGMLARMDRGDDLVNCTRYAAGGRRLGGSLVAGVLSRIANRSFRLLAGSPLTDLTLGIKMIRRSAFDVIALEQKSIGWSVAFELAIKAQLAGLRISEVPVVSIDRLFGGESTFRLVPWSMEYLRWFVWGVVQMRRPRRKNDPSTPLIPERPLPR